MLNVFVKSVCAEISEFYVRNSRDLLFGPSGELLNTVHFPSQEIVCVCWLQPIVGSSLGVHIVDSMVTEVFVADLALQQVFPRCQKHVGLTDHVKDFYQY